MKTGGEGIQCRGTMVFLDEVSYIQLCYEEGVERARLDVGTTSFLI